MWSGSPQGTIHPTYFKTLLIISLSKEEAQVPILVSMPLKTKQQIQGHSMVSLADKSAGGRNWGTIKLVPSCFTSLFTEKMNVNKLSMSEVEVCVLKYLEFIWKGLLRMFSSREMSRFFSQFCKNSFEVVFSFWSLPTFISSPRDFL